MTMTAWIWATCLLTGTPTESIDWRRPRESVIDCRCQDAAGWIKRHTREVTLPQGPSIAVIAWKDPTLDADKPNQLAGYLITDTLWAAHALIPFDAVAGRNLLAGLRRIGWHRNHLHEVLFERADGLWHRPDDKDFVHGHSLGVFPTTNSQSVDVRVFRHRFDADFELGHPSLFAEHAVYRALQEFWTGQPEQAQARIRAILSPTENSIIRWDTEHRVMVDEVHRADWSAWKRKPTGPFRHYSFKGALVLYAMRVLRIESDYPEITKQLSERIWSAQNRDGGVGHFVDVYPNGKSTPAPDATGEACAIAILSETVTARTSP
jgi:hypothetical protein